jgi:hypothetical protein
MASNVDAEIARLSERRSALWSGAVEGFSGEAAKIAKQLEDLYERKRTAKATEGHRPRQEIVRRARVESELERLMTTGRKR